MTEKRELAFSIQGEFVTRLAREKCYFDGQFDYAMKLLMGCMQTDQLSEREIRHRAYDILNGEAELRDTSGTEEYGLYYLDEKDNAWDLEKAIAQSKEKEKSVREELASLQAKYFFVCEHLSNFDLRQINNAYYEETNEPLFEDMACSSPDSSLSPLLNSFLKRAHSDTEDDYGWLEPDGTFHPVEWTEHQNWAQKYLEENHPELAEDDEVDMQIKCNVGLIGAGDWLVEHGWILLHNPAQGIAFITRDESKSMTKSQADFLYGYYIDRDCHEEANAVMQEMNEDWDRE